MKIVLAMLYGVKANCWRAMVGRMVHVERFTRIGYNWVVVSNMIFFHPYLGKIYNLTCIFQMGSNHRQDKVGPYDRYK